MPLHEGRVLGILLSEAKRELGDDGASYGESNQEWPVTVPFSPEKHRPGIEFRHFSDSTMLSKSLPSCLMCKAQNLIFHVANGSD